MPHTPACTKGYSARYYRSSRPMITLTQAKADGTYTKALNLLVKIDMLILDDWGLEPLKSAQRNDLIEIMNDRDGSTSTVIISQLTTGQRYQSIGDNTLADAIL
ncbi:ATP-binding protein [Paraglaciecola sp. L1A13]|uniref:ATP-binding protein n=1 Tax=Paraglaciecola sp. L1A13 TaxID=2686359 RepID=UPI00272CCCD2|nr:ATP-binding protein [Paraglaciecola sp. L1A13]|tara:strand:+ start:23 stop:334 length:312 start_codon:yes stop_codon:yes gene_type:complete